MGVSRAVRVFSKKLLGRGGVVFGRVWGVLGARFERLSGSGFDGGRAEPRGRVWSGSPDGLARNGWPPGADGAGRRGEGRRRSRIRGRRGKASGRRGWRRLEGARAVWTWFGRFAMNRERRKCGRSRDSSSAKQAGSIGDRVARFTRLVYTIWGRMASSGQFVGPVPEDWASLVAGGVRDGGEGAG